LAFGGISHDPNGVGGGIGTDRIRAGLRHNSFEGAQTYKYSPSRKDGQGPVDPQFRRERFPNFLSDALRFVLGWGLVGFGGWLAYSTGYGCTYKWRRTWTAISILCLLAGFASLLLPIGW
jgi:hypothetical protein